MENITIDKAVSALQGRRAKDAEENLALYDGDHLHLGKPNSFGGYIGLLPPPNAKNYAFLTEWLERIYASANLSRSAVTRNIDAVLSRDPDWSLQFPETVGDTERDKLAIETTAAYNKWWDDRDLLKTLFREIAKTALLEGELYLRPIIPVTVRTRTGGVPVKQSLIDALEVIDFEIVSADKAGIFTDRETGRKYSLCYIAADGTKEVEISWVGADELTYLKILRDDDLRTWTKENFASFTKYIETLPTDKRDFDAIDLGGRLYLHKVSRDQLITAPARSLQRSINYALTTMNKNLNIAGSRETSYGNAQKPKTKVVTKDASGNVVKVTEEDAPLTKGADNANFFVGIPVYSPDKVDADGNPILVDYKQPVQFVVDPVAVDTFVKAFETYRELFLDEVSQLHILGSNLTVSGKSKQETRTDFEKSAKATRVCINPAGRYVLDFSLYMSANICRRLSDFKDARFDFKCQITVGAVDAEEIKQEAQDLKDGNSTLYLYLVKKGVEDPDAVIEQLKSADDYVLNQLEKALTIYALSEGKMKLETIIDYLPIEDEDKTALKAAVLADKEPPVNKPQGLPVNE